MRKKQNPISLPRKVAFGASLILASTCSVWANDVQSQTPHKDAIESILQNKVVTGVISDQYGPVIGANVIVKGTTIGTITDMDGKFSLEVPADAVLQISYIGYLTQEIQVTKSTTTVNVILKEDSETLEEVVVVGYGTQKKVNMSGSVSAVNVSELTESRPITNVSQALAGVAAGVNVMSSSNQPGNDNAAIKVRGQGTLNDSAPLVIIDGAEAGINTVNPQDIESISILKDAASASIYGSRAANGVILITTKSGKAGNLRIDYNGYISCTSTAIPDHMQPVSNYADYMELINEGYKNAGLATMFSDGVIKEWRDDAGRNPLKYPNTNWLEESFKNSVAHNHVVSMSGGSEKIKFYSSFGYQKNPGVMDNTGFEKYNARFNVSADVKEWLNISAQLSGYLSNMDPAAKYTNDKNIDTTVDNVFTFAAATTPGMVFRAPDGRFGDVNNSEDSSQCSNNNPLLRLNSVEGNIRKTNMRSRFIGTLKPFKGFTLTGSYSYEFVDEERKSKPVFHDIWNFLTETSASTKKKTNLSNYDGKIERFFNDVVARYETRLIQDKLGINAMLGASQEMYRSHNFTAKRNDLLDTSIGALDGATGDSSASGNSTEWVMRSYFGRVNLDWEQKYLLELNLRADQSSRFLKGNRTGYFPSASFAWRMDQEAFMQPLMDKGLSSLKLRLSYGSLGNNSVGDYDALSVLAGKKYNYSLNGQLAMGVARAKIANANLSWEATYMTNVGVDFGFLNNRLTGTVDYFHKKTKDILINLPAPDVHGNASIPKQNSAEVLNQGIELTLGWQDKIGDFEYGINGNFTYVKNEVTKFKGKDKGGISFDDDSADIIWEGHPINSQYGLRVDRIIQTDEDLALVQQMIDNAPIVDGKKVNPFAAFGTPEKGDLLYKDINGDGIVDTDDREILSDGPNPKFQFGLNLNASWKGIDFAVLFQGQAGAKAVWAHDLVNTSSVRHGYQLNKEVAEGRWYEGRTDAKYPRLLEYNNRKNKQSSDFFLENLAFLKIRNIQLGYTLPSKWTKKASLERVRFYGTLENFFTFTSFRGFDPEMGCSVAYPAMKNVVFGLNLSF